MPEISDIFAFEVHFCEKVEFLEILVAHRKKMSTRASEFKIVERITAAR